MSSLPWRISYNVEGLKDETIPGLDREDVEAFLTERFARRGIAVEIESFTDQVLAFRVGWDPENEGPDDILASAIPESDPDPLRYLAGLARGFGVR